MSTSTETQISFPQTNVEIKSKRNSTERTKKKYDQQTENIGFWHEYCSTYDTYSVKHTCKHTLLTPRACRCRINVFCIYWHVDFHYFVWRQKNKTQRNVEKKTQMKINTNIYWRSIVYGCCCCYYYCYTLAIITIIFIFVHTPSKKVHANRFEMHFIAIYWCRRTTLPMLPMLLLAHKTIYLFIYFAPLSLSSDAKTEMARKKKNSAIL